MAGPDQSEAKAASNVGSTEVLHQRRKLPMCPMRMALAGFGIALTLGFFTLYTHKKPEATALDVAKVVTGTSHPDNTHPPTRK